MHNNLNRITVHIPLSAYYFMGDAIPIKSVLCGNLLFVVFVFSFLFLERSILYIGTVVVPDLQLILKQQPEISTAKTTHTSLDNAYSIRHTIVYEKVVLEEV